MNTVKLPVLLASLLLLASCTPVSLYPFYTQKDLTLDPGFPGVWQNEKDQTKLICKESSGKSYACEEIEKGAGSAVFHVHLMRLGGSLFLDAYPEAPVIAHLWLRSHLVRVHTAGRFQRQGDDLRILMLDSDWVEKSIKEKQIHLAMFPSRDGQMPVLSATRPELQQLLLTASADAKGFKDLWEWRRAK